MHNVRVARRYAQAVMDLGAEQQSLDRIAEDFTFLRNALRESREFVAFLKSPVIGTDRKKSVLRGMLKANLSETVLNFLDLITEKGREEMLGAIIEEFFGLRDERMGIVHVDVRAAVELSGDQHRSIEQRFESMTGKKVRISFSLDKQLKGGFIARIGDTVYDGSVRRQLELLRERFTDELIRN